MLTIAHRGSMTRALQNSPAGIRSALEHGVDVVELDVMTGRDGSFVCVHGFGRGTELTECLATLKGRADLIAHLKGPWPEPDLLRLLDEICAYIPLDHVAFASHRGSVLRRMKSVSPKARLARFGLFPALMALWRRPVWQAALVNQVVLRRSLVRALQSRGLTVYASCVWEVLPRDSVSRLGVDGSFINLP